MNRSSDTSSRTLRTAVAAVALVAALGCSTDSPTAPVQQAPPPPTPPSATWSINVSFNPSELIVSETDPATVTIRVQRADNGNAPPQGTSIVVSTSLGDFVSLASGLQSVALSLVNGRAEVLLFAGSIKGNALVTAQLEGSAGQRSLPIVEAIEPVIASFSFQNSNSNRSVTFQNTSLGNPTTFRWEFGDGATSNLENPSHAYAQGGDYVVKLTARKPQSSDTTSQIVAVPDDEIEEIVANFIATVNGLTVVFQDTSTGEPTAWRWSFGDGATSSAQNPSHTYADEGTYVVTLTALNSDSEDSVNQTVIVSKDLFIRLISPVSGPPTGGTTVTITGQGFRSQLRVFFGDRLGTVLSVSDSEVRVLTPSVELPVEECDSDDDGLVDGLRTLNLAVSVTVELSSGASETVGSGFTYLSPTGGACL